MLARLLVRQVVALGEEGDVAVGEGSDGAAQIDQCIALGRQFAFRDTVLFADAADFAGQIPQGRSPGQAGRGRPRRDAGGRPQVGVGVDVIRSAFQRQFTVAAPPQGADEGRLARIGAAP